MAGLFGRGDTKLLSQVKVECLIFPPFLSVFYLEQGADSVVYSRDDVCGEK